MQADTDGRKNAHHPVGPMVSALMRALSVSFRSSSIARLDGQINKKYQMSHIDGGGNGAEAEDEDSTKPQGGAKGRII